MKEELLIDYLEEAEAELRERIERVQRMNLEYRQSLDRDLRGEIEKIWMGIRKKRAEISEKIYSNMDEFRHLDRYFPELLEVFFEDEHIGKTLLRKRWLLNFGKLKPAEIQAKLNEIRGKRMMLKFARNELAKRGRPEVTRMFLNNFPGLEKKLKPGMTREEAARRLDEMDVGLRREGWGLMIESPMIAHPASRLLQKLQIVRAEESAMIAGVQDAGGRGTIAEHNAKKKLEAAARRRRKAERKLAHLLQSNPGFLKQLKKTKGFAKNVKYSPLEEFAKSVKVRTVKEKPWLAHMKKKLH
ncbi:MAG: hypothetical protein ABII71_06105 [Candidatus Micrarchaeota archaeon]